jgi:hypothetical protein
LALLLANSINLVAVQLECGQDSKQDFSDQSEALGGIKMKGIDARKVPEEIQL